MKLYPFSKGTTKQQLTTTIIIFRMLAMLWQGLDFSFEEVHTLDGKDFGWSVLRILYLSAKEL